MFDKAMMYSFTLCKTKGFAKVHVMRLDLEYICTPGIYTDFLRLCIDLREQGVDAVAVAGNEGDKEWLDIVDRTLYDFNFDVLESVAELPE